jgi:DNA-binding NarL/FixJ family response regulator
MNTPSTSRPRVVIADDHPRALHAVMGLLDVEKFQVVAAVPDGDLALDAVERFHPDLVILDVCMPHMDGIRAARELNSKGFSGSIIFLTVQEDDDYLSAAFAAGARGYVLKSRMRSDLLPAIGEALAGKTFVSALSSQN